MADNFFKMALKRVLFIDEAPANGAFGNSGLFEASTLLLVALFAAVVMFFCRSVSMSNT